MNTRRKVLLIVSWTLFLGNVCYCDEEEPKAPPARHENFPRLFNIFSRPGDKGTEKQEGSFVSHIGNVFRGGSIGFQGEIRPLAPFVGIIDKAKEFIPNPLSPGSSPIDKVKDLFPIPFIPGITKPKDMERREPDVQPKPDDQDKPEDTKPRDPEDEEEPDDTKSWEPENPDAPNPTGPKLEELDEDAYEYGDYTTEPIENIIQPRIRHRRSPESRVFHVPLQFLSNAKPFEVKIK